MRRIRVPPIQLSRIPPQSGEGGGGGGSSTRYFYPDIISFPGQIKHPQGNTAKEVIADQFQKRVSNFDPISHPKSYRR